MSKLKKIYTIRPYYGYDCDSVMGFNNGHYLDPITVPARDTLQAMIRAMALWRRTEGNYAELKRTRAHNTWFSETCFYIETGHYDAEGNEMTPEQWNAIEDHDAAETSYRYQYIDFQDIQEGETE